MQIGYYLVRVFTVALSRLSLTMLYRLSDLGSLLLYRVFRYRHQVIKTNLRRSFPGQTNDRHDQIHRSFVRHLCDLLVETIKLATMSGVALRQMVELRDFQQLETYFVEGRSVVLMLGHMGNWELAGPAFAMAGIHRTKAIYHPLHNSVAERFMYRLRTRWSVELYAMPETLRYMLRDRQQVTATAFIADQAPPPQHARWLEFLHQDTAVFGGAEKLARRFNYPVFYMSILKPSRGRYTITPALIAANPQQMPEGTITQSFMELLEHDIRKQPEIWLWSHRRWKHQRQ